MIKGLFGPSSLIRSLRTGLDESMQTHRRLAERVARYGASSSEARFSDALGEKRSAAEEEARSLQTDMALLADTQIRYETEAKLLQGAYAKLRSAIRGGNV